MTAIKTLSRRKTAQKAESANSRPVTDTLLELAYMMHVTKVVAVREESNSRPAATGRHSR